MPKFDVYYMKPESFRDFIVGKLPTIADLDKTHVLLRLISTGSLDRVFQCMQAEMWSPNGEARDLIKEKGLAHTSMCVGDVVKDENGDYYVCASVGWKRLQKPHDSITVKDIAKLIKKCAFEMDAEDKTSIDTAHAEGREFLGRGTTSGPSVRGLEICHETARGMGLEALGEITYYLLAYTWNDALDWADRNCPDEGGIEHAL